MIIISLYAILALGLNLVVGYTGLLSVMHAAFYGVGAYVSALFMTQLGITFFAALVLSVFGCCCDEFRDWVGVE